MASSSAVAELRTFIAEEPDVLARFRSCLSLVPPDAANEAHDHAARILGELSQFDSGDKRNAKHTFHAIDDAFFNDNAGGVVKNADYAYTELVGPTGSMHYHEKIRAGLSCQGAGLTYLGHQHAARELYFVLEGTSSWWTDTVPQWEARTISFHQSWENHAMRTGLAGGHCIYFWSWTGEDIDMEVDHSLPDVQARL